MPKAQMIKPTTPRTYTVERLQELRREADLAGDTASRDALAAMIRELGGTVPTGEIPENETKMGRLERLRQDALAAGDTLSAVKLADMIAEEKTGVPAGELPDYASDKTWVAKGAFQNAIEAKESPQSIAELEKACEISLEADRREDEKAEYDPTADVAVNIVALANASHRFTDFGPPVDWHECWTPEHLEELDRLVNRKNYYGEHRPQVYLCEDGLQDYLNDIYEVGDIERVNDGTASVNAMALIEKRGYLLSDIPARFGGKVDLTDVKHYRKILEAE